MYQKPKLSVPTPYKLSPQYAQARVDTPGRRDALRPDYGVLATSLQVIESLITVDFEKDAAEDIRFALTTCAINLQKLMMESLPLFNDSTKAHINKELTLKPYIVLLNNTAISLDQLRVIDRVLRNRIKFLKTALPN
jgi:hypothetical protein